MIFSPIIFVVMIVAAITIIFFGYMSKAHERRSRAKAHKIARLKVRARKLDSIIFGLPAAYLPKTLKVLIYASIVDSLTQMHSLSGNDSINQQIERVRQTLSTLVDIEPSPSVTCASQNSSVELKECKYLLKDLYSLILEFHSEGTLNKKTTHTHLEIIKSLMLSVTLDTYKTAANAALIDNNTGLALHYNSTALNRLSKDQGISGFDEEIRHFQEQISSLEQRMLDTIALSDKQDGLKDAALAEWKAHELAGEDWKKKRF
jgi:hypothetical protein